MKRVAVLFDNFGNPSQPFLKEWYFRIAGSQSLRIKGFTDKFWAEAEAGIVVLKTGGIIRYLRRVQQIFSPVLQGVNPSQIPLVRFSPDVVHILNAQQADQYQSLLNTKSIKAVYSFRGFETSVRPKEDATWAKRLREIYQEATALHFVSDFLRNEAISLGAPASKCHVIRRSVNTDFFTPAAESRTADGVRFIAVGRLTWQKGYSILLRAFAAVLAARPEVRLTIIGDGPDAPAIITEIRGLNLNSHVLMIPHLDRYALQEQLCDADIFVQASLSDAMPNSVLEASACGLPVISTWTGGIPEAVDHGETGILVNPGDATQLSDAMIRLHDDVQLRTRLGSNGRHFMISNFSASLENTKWEEFYNAV